MTQGWRGIIPCDLVLAWRMGRMPVRAARGVPGAIRRGPAAAD
jgi:hypothetical protein